MYADSVPAHSETCLSRGMATGAQIVAVGTYQGGLPLDGRVDPEGHEIRSVALHAAPTGRPLFLVLSAYDPVVWDLREVPKQRLRAVHVTGYHVQSVRGAGDRPVQVTTYPTTASACGSSYNYAYQGGPKLERLDQSIRRLAGRGIDRFTGGYALKRVTLDGPSLQPRPALPLPPRTRVHKEPQGSSPGESEAGLQVLLARGAIRKATHGDLAALNSTLTRRSLTGHLAPVRASISLSEAYVVLRPITVPTDMYGADSAHFLVPRGVPLPSDPGSHNSYWVIATGECRGVSCGVDD